MRKVKAAFSSFEINPTAAAPGGRVVESGGYSNVRTRAKRLKIYT